VGDAKPAVAKVIALVPGFKLSGYSGFIGQRHQLVLDRDVTALRKSGLPE
tara:strand:- start:97 stop:246 length:150 start_codon:yes stop_codon:yes gene_type:complete